MMITPVPKEVALLMMAHYWTGRLQQPNARAKRNAKKKSVVNIFNALKHNFTIDKAGLPSAQKPSDSNLITAEQRELFRANLLFLMQRTQGDVLTVGADKTLKAALKQSGISPVVLSQAKASTQARKMGNGWAVFAEEEGGKTKQLTLPTDGEEEFYLPLSLIRGVLGDLEKGSY